MPKRIEGAVYFEDLLDFALETGRDKPEATRLWNVIGGRFPEVISNKNHRPVVKAASTGRLWSLCTPKERQGGFVIDRASILRAARHLEPGSVPNYGPKQEAFFTAWVEHLK